MKALNTILLLLIIQLGFSQMKPSTTWTDYQTIEGVKIEYKFTQCTPDNGREQVLVLFRYTNTTQDKIELTWKSEKWRDNICVNCNSSSTEHNRFIVLNPYEIIEATGSTKTIKSHYIFANFTVLVPGMTKQQLTDFKFQNPTKKIL